MAMGVTRAGARNKWGVFFICGLAALSLLGGLVFG
jgi:hypothetical protein